MLVVIVQTGWAINKTLFAVLVLLYPLVDLLRVFALRIKDGKSPFVADQRHLHHALLKKLKSPKNALLVILLIDLFIVLISTKGIV